MAVEECRSPFGLRELKPRAVVEVCRRGHCPSPFGLRELKRRIVSRCVTLSGRSPLGLRELKNL